MSNSFVQDSTESLESSSIILPFIGGQSPEDILSQPSTGGLEYQNSELVPAETPHTDQFLLGQSPLYGNNSSADILNAGETREASSISDIFNGVQNTFQDGVYYILNPDTNPFLNPIPTDEGGIAGKSFSTAYWLHDITGQRIPINGEFVGTNRGNSADFYKFEISQPRRLSYKVHNYTHLIDVEIMDAWGQPIAANEQIEGAYSVKQGGFIHELVPGTYYARVDAPQDPNLSTGYDVVFNLEEPPLFNSESPSFGYFNELATWSDQQWDWAAGDNTRITGPLWSGEDDETNYQGNQAIRQIYNDMATAIVGNTYPSSAGYVQDPSYWDALGRWYGWHSGIDIDTPNWIPTEVRALVGGTAQVVQWDDGNQFLEIAGDDGRFYRYGHLSSLKIPSGRVNQGDVIGEVGMSEVSNHLHFQVNETQYRPIDYNNQDQNKVYQWTLNPLKVFWELKR